MTKAEAIKSINEKFGISEKIDKENMLDFLCELGCDPITMEEVLTYFSKQERYNVVVVARSTDDEDNAIEEIYQKIQIAIESIKDLMTFYNEKRKDALDMVDLDVSQELFASYCKKLKMLDKPMAAISNAGKVFRDFCDNKNNINSTKKYEKDNQSEHINKLKESDIIVGELSLDDDFTGRSLSSFVFQDITHDSRSWKNFYIKICELLYSLCGEKFKTCLLNKEMQGKKRNNFSTNRDGMRSPVYSESLNLYIETNNSANTIRNMIKNILSKCDIDYKSVVINARR